MNHVYRLIWREASGGFVAVAEMARACGARTSRKQLAAACVLLVASGAQAAGTGFNVVNGSATLATAGATTTVTQTTKGVRIDWQTLGVAAGETLKFVQPSSSAVALNVVTGGVGTEILGTLLANGNVFILNPNGVLIGNGAQVNVGGFMASTSTLSSFDVATGKTVLQANDSTAEVRNEGSIVATQGGMVALVGNKVINAGSIVVPGGGVYLLGGGRVEFKPGDGSPFTYSLTTDSTNAKSVVNSGTLSAIGGQIAMDARSSKQAVVNSTGVIEAGQLSTGANGVIRLAALGGHGQITASGTVDPGLKGSATAVIDGGGSLSYQAMAPSQQGVSPGQNDGTTWATVQDKTYDGTRNASVSVDLNKLRGTPSLTLNLTSAQFSSINAGNRTAALVGTVTSSGFVNYVLPASLAAKITPKEITTTTVTRTYDGTTVAEVVYNADDILAIDQENLTVLLVNGQFVNMNAGVNKAVSYGWNLSGNGLVAKNYTLSGTSVGTITPKVIGTTGGTKVYDGNTSATLTYNADDILAADKDKLTVTLGDAEYADKNAGNGKAIDYDWTLTGSGVMAKNYVLAGTTTGSITKAQLTITSSDVTKTYDGTTTAAGAAVAGGQTSLKGTDTLSGGDFAFVGKNAGTGKTVTVGGVTVNDGNGGNNYDVTYVANTTSTIDRAQLTLSAVGDTKVFDNTTTSSATPQASGLVTGDSLTGLSQSFDSSAVGARRTNVDSGYVLADGNGGNNYTVTLVSADAAITAPLPNLDTVINNGGNQPTPVNVDLAGLGDLLAQLPPTAAGEEEDPEKIKARRRSDRSPLRVTDGGVKAPQALR